jgi:hypothetical protein
MHDSDMEIATVIDKPETQSNPTKDYQMKLAFPKNKDCQHMMSDFVSNMFEHDSAATYNLHI